MQTPKLFMAYKSIEKQQLYKAALHSTCLDASSFLRAVEKIVLRLEIKHANVYYSGGLNNS
jgi:hypothetical protein